MSLKLMRDKLRELVGNPTTVDYSDAWMDARVNEAYLDICLKYKFKATRMSGTFSTADGTSKYGLPTDCYAVISAYDVTNSQPLQKYGWKLLDEQVGVQGEGKPLYYTTFREYIQLIPTPDAVYSIRLRWKSNVAKLSGDSALMIIPSSWEDVVTFYARFYAYQMMQEFEKSGYALNVFRTMVAEIPDQQTEEATDFDSAVEMPQRTGGRNRMVNDDPTYTSPIIDDSSWGE
jgi:hypothetical protein